MPRVVGDGLGGHRVITGDHAHPDTRGACLGDGRLGLGPRRVDDAHEGEQRDARDERQQVGRRVERRRIEVQLAGRHDPQALLAQPLVLREVGVPQLVDRDRHAVRAVRVRGARQELVGCPLDVAPDDVLRPTSSAILWNVAMNL